MDLLGDVSPLIWSSKWLVGISQNFKCCSVEVTPLCLLHTAEAAVKIFRCRRCNIHCSSIRWWTMAFQSFRHKLILVSPLTPLLYSGISSTVTQRANYAFVFAISYSCRHQHKWITATKVLQLALPAYSLIWLHPVGRDCTQLGADIRRPILSNYIFQGLLLCVSGSCSPLLL